jgi:hypothetical protein
MALSESSIIPKQGATSVAASQLGALPVAFWESKFGVYPNASMKAPSLKAVRLLAACFGIVDLTEALDLYVSPSDQDRHQNRPSEVYR